MKIYPNELTSYMVKNFCNNYGPISEKSSVSEKSEQDDAYLRQILNNVFHNSGYNILSKFLLKKGQSKISLQKLIKSIQKNYTESDWLMIKKLHKKSISCNSSMKSEERKNGKRRAK